MPAVAAVAAARLRGVREPVEHQEGGRPTLTAPHSTLRPGSGRDRSGLVDSGYVVGRGLNLTLARFSEAFLVLRAEDVGLPPHLRARGDGGYEQRVLGLQRIRPASSRTGRLGGRRTVLVFGIAFLVVRGCDPRAKVSPRSRSLCSGWPSWGLHMGFSQGLFCHARGGRGAARGCAGPPSGSSTSSVGIALLGASVLAGGAVGLPRPESDVPRRRGVYGNRACCAALRASETDRSEERLRAESRAHSPSPPCGRGCPSGGEAERGRVRGDGASRELLPPLTRLALRSRSALRPPSPTRAAISHLRSVEMPAITIGYGLALDRGRAQASSRWR